jgi:hypothetical protein
MERVFPVTLLRLISNRAAVSGLACCRVGRNACNNPQDIGMAQP